MNLLVVCGSTRIESKTRIFLEGILHRLQHCAVTWADLSQLPLFHPDYEDIKTSELEKWLQQVQSADLVLITTPEYIHNIPAALKSALEWATKSGIFHQKKVIAFIYTPRTPRGQYAMISLLHSLKALHADILLQELLHHDDLPDDVVPILQEIIDQSATAH